MPEPVKLVDTWLDSFIERGWSLSALGPCKARDMAIEIKTIRLRVKELEKVAEAARAVELAWTMHHDAIAAEMLALIVANAALKEEHE
jgi:hypothetical protein